MWICTKDYGKNLDLQLGFFIFTLKLRQFTYLKERNTDHKLNKYEWLEPQVLVFHATNGSEVSSRIFLCCLLKASYLSAMPSSSFQACTAEGSNFVLDTRSHDMRGTAHSVNADSPGEGSLRLLEWALSVSRSRALGFSQLDTLVLLLFVCFVLFLLSLDFFYFGSTFSFVLCGGQMKKSVFQMCLLACDFFRNSLSGITVCGLVLFF